MFKYKNAMISMAVVAMLAACGGGGGGDDDNDRNGSGSNGGGTSQPGNNPGGTSATADAKFAAGAFNLSGGGIVIGTAGGEGVAQLPYAEFVRDSTAPRDDNSGYGLYGQAKGDFAPLESFGVGVTFEPATPGATGTSVGRVAFELQDQTTGTASPANALRIMVDKVTYSVDAMGDVSVELADDSKAYVYAKNGASAATVTTTAASTLVREVEGIEAGDPARFALVLDVDKAVEDAIAAGTAEQKVVLESVKDFTGPLASPFKVSMTFSNLNIQSAGEELKGATISVNGSNVPGIKDGGGVTGYLQVE